jgi:hypothetical protein
MGYLDKSTITVDAILTKRGREKLAAGTFDITKFALADDEVDYTLWDENHGKGTNYYGQAIENMPMVEAVPDQSKVMRYKLMTLSKNIQKMPYLQLNPGNETISLSSWNAQTSITAVTTVGVGGTGGQMDDSYTAIVSDGTLVTLITADGDVSTTEGGSISGQFHLAGGSTDIVFKGNNLSTTTTKTTTITIIGNISGITQTVTISVPFDNTSTGVA